jgi:hypothetical protein
MTKYTKISIKEKQYILDNNILLKDIFYCFSFRGWKPQWGHTGPEPFCHPHHPVVTPLASSLNCLATVQQDNNGTRGVITIRHTIPKTATKHSYTNAPSDLDFQYVAVLLLTVKLAQTTLQLPKFS